MPAPTTVPELTDQLRKSGLVPPDRLGGFLAGLAAADRLPAAPAALLDRLVESGLLTRFQAGKLAAGKYKGFRLGSYLLLDQLGAGGMGQVFLAEHATMRRLVALKVLSVYATDDPVARERFMREARAAAALDHPNIARVFDLCQDGRLLYLVMEYVDGVSFQALVGRGGPAAVGAAVRYARQALAGLQCAHDGGFVHRDIKPANLLVDRTGVVKVLDLGLVRSDADEAGGLTRQMDDKTVLGTADYVAPEQAVDSSAVDHRADLYSLGATLYYLLAGRPLFPDGRSAQKLIWQQTRDPDPLAAVRPDVPAGLAGVVHKLLEKRPADRFQTAAEAFAALEPWDPGEPVPPDERLLPPPARALAGRPAPTPPPGSGSHVLLARPRLPAADSSSETDSVAARDTARTPVPVPPPPVHRPAGRPGRRVGWRTAAVLAAAAAAVAVLAAILTRHL